MQELILKPGQLTLADLHTIYFNSVNVRLDEAAFEKIQQSKQVVDNIIASDETVYGINTGFGLFANQKISVDQLKDLQTNIVLSHSAGIGDYLNEAVSRLVLVLKINSLSCGYSGVRQLLIDYLIQFVSHEFYPCIHSKGSVGASGDLAPLADVAQALIGLGHVWHKGKQISATQALEIMGLTALELDPKEGLALLNGTQVSTALAIQGLLLTQRLFAAAINAGAMSVEAAKGSHSPFDERIHAVRNQQGQIKVAAMFRLLLEGSDIARSHLGCEKVQDPYSLRCQPQVMGACLDQIEHAQDILVREANAVTDNPLVFGEQGDVISGGNFHAEPVAFAADILALVIAEIGNMSERRTTMLVDPTFSNLPAFLVANGGLHSGLMIAQVTAAALVSENKSHAHPSSVDSIPTSANQEDHVSMATYGARRLAEMLENAITVVAIELIAAAQGIDFRAPLKPAGPVQKLRKVLRSKVAFYSKDRLISPDIKAVVKLIYEGRIEQA